MVVARADGAVELWDAATGTLRGTAELMRRFYSRLNAGEGRSQALRRAKLELLASDDWAHPYYWAPFIGGGDWRTLDGDEPRASVKTYESLDAVETELHALASCLAVGFAYNAAAQGIQVEELEFDLEGELDLHGFLGLSDDVRAGYKNIQVNYRVKADAPREKIEELCDYVQKTSPVVDVLTNPVPVNVELQS